MAPTLDCREGGLVSLSPLVNLNKALPPLFFKAKVIVSLLCVGSREPFAPQDSREEETKAKGQAVSTEEQGQQARALHGLKGTARLQLASKKPLGPGATSPYRETRSFS